MLTNGLLWIVPLQTNGEFDRGLRDDGQQRAWQGSHFWYRPW